MISQEERDRINREIADILGMKYVWPRWSEHLALAWQLHERRPPGTILFNTEWVDIPAEDVAYEICRAFVRAKQRAESQVITVLAYRSKWDNLTHHIPVDQNMVAYFDGQPLGTLTDIEAEGQTIHFPTSPDDVLRHFPLKFLMRVVEEERDK